MEHSFTGEYQHTIDDKGRITLPASFRPELERGVVVTRGLDGCLFLYPQEEWDKVVAKIKEMPLTDLNVRKFIRHFVSGASPSQPDKQGRILLPAYLREYAQIETDAVITGSLSWLEIWNSERWREALATAEQDSVSTASQITELFRSL